MGALRARPLTFPSLCLCSQPSATSPSPMPVDEEANPDLPLPILGLALLSRGTGLVALCSWEVPSLFPT